MKERDNWNKIKNKQRQRCEDEKVYEIERKKTENTESGGEKERGFK